MKKSLSYLVSLIGNILFWFKREAYLPFNGDWCGLGNRVKGIANFYQLGYRKFTLIWNTKSWVTDSFNHLFILKGCIIHEVTSNEKKYVLCTKILRRFLPLGVVKEECPFWSFILPRRFHYENLKHKWSFSNKETYSIDFKFNEIPEDIRNLYRPFFSALYPSSLVKERICSVELPSNIVGVQIRNTGIKADAKDVSSLQTIYAAMERESSDTLFFISAMNDEIASLFKARFQGRIIELPNKDYSSMVDAVADMWLLGHCAKMIASPGSTFSEVAWWWGGAKIPVDHLKSEYNQASS